MADSEWRLEEDGQLKLDVKCNSLIYHPNLNIILVLTKSSEVLVVDVNSGILLQRSLLSESDTPIHGQYLPGYDKILLANDKGIGVRSDYNGVLLLDTILQTPITKPDDIVKLEIPLSEAHILKQTLECMDLQGVERVGYKGSEVIEELSNKIKEADAKSKKGLKAQKWNTVCLCVSYSALKWVCGGMVSELRRQNRHTPALSAASAISDRLNWLLDAAAPGSAPPPPLSAASTSDAASPPPPPDRTLMFSEAIRRQTFANWPHMNYKWALPDQMAQAGFYHQPNSAGDDRAMCFTCIVCLVCWEPTDEPWSEHERHSPSCPFVKGEYTQNVPLSVTYATAPAVATPAPTTLLATSSVPELTATAAANGLVQVWNCARRLKNEISFYSFGSDAKTYPREGWAEHDVVEIPLSDTTLDNLIKKGSSEDIKLGAVSIVGMLKHPSPPGPHDMAAAADDDDDDFHGSRYRRPALITGVSVRSKRSPSSASVGAVSPAVRAMNDVNQNQATNNHLDIMKVMDASDSSSTSSFSSSGGFQYDRQLLLVVYDFHYESSGRAPPREGGWGGGGGGGGPGGSGSGINNVAADGNVNGNGSLSWSANQSGGASKKVGSGTGTGTSASRPENNIQEIFLSKLFYCQNSLMDDVDALPPDPQLHYDATKSSIHLSEAFPSQSPSIAVVVPPVGGGTFNASAMGLDVFPPSTSSSVNLPPPSTPPFSNAIKVSVSNRELKGAQGAAGSGGNGSYKSEGGSGVETAPKEPASVQCVTVDSLGRHSAITGIHPTKDGRHLLVTLGSDPDEEEEDGEGVGGGSRGGVFVMYGLVFDGPVVSVRENPLCWREFQSEPKQVLLLPLAADQTTSLASPLGVAVIVTEDGAVHIIDVASLETLSSKLPPEGTKFVTATYCFSLERLCVSTADGDLHFFSMKDSDDRKQDEASSLSMDQSSSPQKPNDKMLATCAAPWQLRELRLLYELTQFENLSPCYAATVPACWTELMQAQKQRRHPQHLQHADEVHHTRSWRLQHDNSTWDEHVLEMTLPQSVCIGHVDVKFTLHSHCATPPQIEVTLLKQNATAIGRHSRSAAASASAPAPDATVDFNLNTDSKKGFQENPVTNEEYLETHNMEVLAGPINLASCLDLTEQGGTITFSSVKLFRVRSRTLLVHMKSLADPAAGQASGKKAKVDPNFSWDMSNMANSTPDSIVERLTNASRKVEYVGCDWIHEVSITIRKAKQTEIPNERLERYAMLESNTFVEKLLDVIFASSSSDNGDRGRVEQSIALDILNWIAVIRLGRLRCCEPNWHRLQLEFVKLIQAYQHVLIQTCFVQGGRSTAQKCVKLFTICSDGVKNLEDNSLKDFNRSLVEVFLESLNSILQSWSAGAMRWFFHCLARMIAADPNSALKASYRSLMLLSKVARHLKIRQNPSYLLLRSRFGLYGTPLEAELFDIEPPVPAKFSSMPVTYASLVAQELAWAGGVGVGGSLGGASSSSAAANEPIDLRELLPIFGNGNNQSESGKPNLYHNLAKLKGLTSNLYMKGLLEVEPLHFTCHSTSDGTKLEKMESVGMSNPWGNLYEAQPFHLAASETNKAINELAEEELVQDLKEKIGSAKMKKLRDVLVSLKVAKSIYKKEMLESVLKSSSSAAATSVTFGSDCTASSSGGGCTSSSHSAKPQSLPTKDGPLSWQQLLTAPAQQMLVIERMHSGARRFVVLDLGCVVLLTDLIVPSCPELLSLSVDIWTRSEEVDAQRLVVASDIASKTLVMSDIQPPPVCRYIKITTIGRYGMSTTKCKIPIGSFFGHMVLLPGEDYAEKNSLVQNMTEENTQNQIQVLSALFEDVQCRYSLACSKLENLVTPLLSSESPNVGHMYNYLHKVKETANNLETQKITTAYQECITYQHQLNIIRSVMRRFGAKSAPVSTDIQQNLTTSCTDKLRVLGESLTDLLLYIVYGVGFDPRVDSAHLHQMVDESQCERLFNCICVGEDIRMQVSCCTLLVRLCGLQPWWGSFLVNTIKQLYSSKQFNIFPQDRVFILLIYMGRKSLCGGANRSSVMDSLLKTILNQLQSLATSADDQEEGAVGGGEEAGAVGGGTGFFRLQMDLSLVGWLLLFLSQCLDSQPSFCSLDELPDKIKNSKNSAPASRWDFLQGEMAMQRRTYLTNKCTASRNYRRKLQKKLMHHKQQLDDLESAKKAFHASTQALSALSSQAAKLSCKLETALKQQEQYYKKSAKQATSPRTSKDQQGSFRSSRSGESCSDSDGKRGSNSLKDSDCQFLMLPRTHCLPVARALIKFLLHMDITCNIDLFLLVCKVIARVTVWTKPGVSLGEIMTQDQLASLLLIAVSNRSVWGGPWASHAITCLLQDIIQGVNSKPSSPVDQADSRAESKESDDPMRMPMREPSILDVNIMPGPSSSSSVKNGESYVLPSLFESDDSDMEDLLEDILERGKTLFIRKSSSRMAVGAVSSISTALDSRLEYGLENNVSVNLRRITAQAAYNLPLCINSSIAQKGLQNDGSSLPVWDESITAPWQLPANSSVGLSSIEMLSTAFDTLFGQLNQSRDGDLEAVVQLWLTLSTENDSGGGGRNFDASVVPLIQLSPSAISSLMSTLANRGGISVREWCLSFQALTLFSNLQCTSPPTSPTPSSDQLEHALCGAASLVVNDANFVPMLDAFLSSPHIKGCAGVSVCNSLHELLVRLEMRCDVVSGNSTWGNRLKELLLNLVYMLVSEGGAIAALYGPLDAQTGLILLLLHLNFPNINLSTAVGILQSVGVLIERYVLNAEGTGGGSGASGRGGRGGGGASEAASHSGSQSQQQQQPMGGSSLTFVLNNPSWEHLLIVIIRLVTNLVQTPLEAPPGEDTQTDEHKAAHSSQAPVKAKCVADFVVQQERTMAQLIGGLGGCQWSSFSMLRSGGSGGYSPDSSDPVSIGDALLQLLSTLANKATDPKLILKPLFTHLSTCGLTVPLQWLVLQVLDSDQALRELLDMSGMDIISANLVETTGMLISSQPSTVSVIMQYLSQMPNCAPLTASSHHKKGCSSSSGGGGGNYANNSTAVATVNNNNNNNNNGGNSSGSNGGAHVTSSSSSSHLESHDSMVNFAPLGIICSSNPTSQSADVLIQPAPPHRRARTPAWSYHFYSEESWVDLTITLPCAVLLKAVHIQPHLSSLATCPSGVSVEISRDGGRSGFVPVAAPFNTSGLTHVRLTLPHAEVVTSVLLRLYKPRDSSNIGLSQIKLLGATTFGDSDLPDARRPSRYTQSSLGWLRLLHHCLTACSDPALRRSLLDAASGSPAASASPAASSAHPAASSRLLSACCSLLLASSGPAAVTESVLLTLGLHSSQLGLQLIGVLLNNGGSLASAVQSVVGLLFRLGTTVDANIRERLAAMLDWLHQAATTVQNQLSTAYIQCLSSILWTCYEKNLYCDLPSMITQPLFSSVYEWTLKLSPHSCLKKAIDSVLCSMCYINPALFPTLLQRMNILVPICTSSPQASISDDRKDTEQSASSSSSSLTDDSKEQWWGGRVVLQDHTNLALSEGQLLTVAVACQSPPATRHLLDSGLPSLIAHALLGFCLKKKNSESKNEPANQSRMTDSDKASGRNHVISVDAMGVMLKFLEEVCMAGQMRDWLGSPEGSIFWGPLLSLLCNKPSNEKRCDVSSTLHSLESATVSFLARCCWCHPNNQKLLAKVLSDVISQHKTTNHKTGGISGVTRRMILQLLLESEKVFVSVEGWSGQNNGVITPTHPRHVSRLVHLSVHTTIADILRMISGAASVSDGGSGSGGGGGGSGEGVWEVRGGGGGHDSWQEVDMSVAAGVTAKDKRLKDAKNAQQRATPYGKKARTNQPDTQSSQNMRLCLRHPDLEEKVLPGSLTLSQLLYILDERGISLSNPYIFLTLDIAKSSSTSSDGEQTDLTQSPNLPTALQVFTQQGGLALLAEHLPPVYPETLARLPPPPPPPATTAPDSASAPAASASAVVDQVVYDAWVKVEPNDDIYEDLDEYVCLGEGQSSSTVVSGGAGGKSGGGRGGECGGGTPTVPLHSLAAFGLFLRLPGYAEVLLRDKCKAQCLLRLTLGVTDDGEGGDILTCPVAGSLPTLPFEVLRLLLESTPLTTDDGRLLRRTALDTGALRLLLACLAIFTHQPPSSSPNTNQTAAGTKQQPTNDKGRGAEEKSHLYWAKGTGFGTGSTAQSWNVEQALSRQRTEEEHVTVLLQVLSSYINPGGKCETVGGKGVGGSGGLNLDMETSSEESTDVEEEREGEGDGDEEEEGQERNATPPLPPQFHDILQQSCLLPALSSYLRNDSVLDMARHIPLYRAVLQLLRAMALNPQLVSLLLPQKATIAANQLSIVCLLVKMQNCVDIYANRLKNNNKAKGHRKSVRTNNNNNNNNSSTSNNNNTSKTQEEMDNDEGLALLIPDIQQTACLVQVLTNRIVYDTETDGESTSHAEVEQPLQRTLEERYLEVMKALQFDTYDMIVEKSDSSGFQFVVGYHFESNVRSCGERSHPARMKRLAQETVTLSTSLPLSYSSSVFVRCDSDRLDIMKVLITGPAETPYANGCFELDVFFPPDYPNSPMLINLETTGHHTIRFNPNLYNDGKVCLSVLNTWQGRPEEKWNAHTSSFLQVLVSIQSLILVPEPYFNEPGYERSRGTPSGDQSSREYNSNICQATVKWAMLEQLRNPSPCFKQIIQTHFYMKQKEIRNQIENWIVDMESQANDRRTGRSISLNAIALKRHYHQLLEELGQLQPPPGMEDLAEVEVPSASSTMAAGPAPTTTPATTPAPNDHETDLQMEKMVSQVCE